MPTLGPVTRTARGFEIIEFKDRSEVECSLQASSLADYTQPGISAVWLGPNEAHPRVLAREAASVGVQTSRTTGWVDFPVPENVMMTTRAHLDHTQVRALIRHLQNWLNYGTFQKVVENKQ